MSEDRLVPGYSYRSGDLEAVPALVRVSGELQAVLAERDRLIREHEGSLREIAEAAGLSHETVRVIKAKEEK